MIQSRRKSSLLRTKSKNVIEGMGSSMNTKGVNKDQ